MDRSEENLFVSAAVGISFQLGFSSLLLAAAKARGPEATRWLSEFEERVIHDARHMRVGADIPEALVTETIETVVAEFRQVFESVRCELHGNPGEHKRRDRSPFPDYRIRLCGRGPGQL